MRATFRIDISAGIILAGVAVHTRHLQPPHARGHAAFTRRLARAIGSARGAARALERRQLKAGRARTAGVRRVRLRLLPRSENRRRHDHPRREADRLVLVRRAIEPGYGKWVFPGGYVDRGEPLTVAAIREAREECGLDVRLDGLVNVYSYPGRAPVIVVYAATAIGGRLEVDDEGLEAAEVKPNAIPWDELAFRSTHEALRDYLAGLLHPLPR